jgi:hypothetical protein
LRILGHRQAFGFTFHHYRYTFDNRMAASPLLVRARALTGFVDLVRSHGANPDRLLRAVGIPPAMLNNPDATFALQALTPRDLARPTPRRSR